MLKRFLIAAVALSLSACTWHQHRIEVPTSPELDPDTACPSWRWIGVKSPDQDSCPIPAGAGWTIRPLFTMRPEIFDGYPLPQDEVQEAAETQAALEEIPPGLRSFCLYRHDSEGNDRDIPNLVAQRKLVEAAEDCAAIGTMAEEPLDTLEQHFLTQAGATAMSSAALRGKTGHTVRLAFLDSQPTHEGIPEKPGRSRHGYALAHLARSLICPNGDCTARITTQLALPIVEFDRGDAGKTLRDEARGGFFGTYGDLATAVRREVAAWQASGEDRLVLNLSLGWDGQVFGDSKAPPKHPGHPSEKHVKTRDPEAEPGETPRLEAPALSVLSSLQDAACRGALVVVAAGNRTGGPRPGQGPLLPAGWETMGAPGPETCAEILGSEEAARYARESPGPLLYAAGGVRSEGYPLANSRPAAEPPRVAYADHAVVEGHDGRPTVSYTGSSVASAVVAATSAAVWHYDPVRPRSELMALVHRAGDDLERAPDFFHPSESPRVRRVSLCRALELCAAQGGGCPSLPPCPPWSRRPPSLTAWMSTQSSPNVIDSTLLSSKLGKVAGCSATDILHQPPPAGAVPVNPCPFDQFHDVTARSWTSPQPEDPPCPTCLITKGSPTFKLYIEIEQAWEGGLLHDATLNVGQTKYHLGLAPLSKGQTAIVKEIKNLQLDSDADVPIFVSFRIDHNGEQMSVQSPVFFAP